MNPRDLVCRWRRSAVLASTIILLTGWGCAPSSEKREVLREQASFPNATDTPRVVVFGDLDSLLPRYDATPWLDLFLHGPNDYGKTALRNPQGIARLGRRLLVCDQGQPDVIAVDLDNGQSLRWGTIEHRPRCPVAITVGEPGLVFVADSSARVVRVFNEQGRFLYELAPLGPSSEDFKPCGLCVHGGILYVADPRAKCVWRWDILNEEWLVSWVPPAGQPVFIAPTDVCVSSEGVFFIVDSIRACVYRVRENGQWLPPVGRRGRSEGEFVRPKQAACSASSLLFVSDAGRQSVMVFTTQGRYITEIHEQPGGWTGWTLPAGLLILDRQEAASFLRGKEDSASIAAMCEAFVIVTDALGAAPLTLLGIITDTESGK